MPLISKFSNLFNPIGSSFENIIPTPSVTPTLTPTPSSTLTPTPTLTITPTPSLTPTPSSTLTPTPSETPTPSVTPTSSIAPTNSVTPTMSVTPSITPTITPSSSSSGGVAGQYVYVAQTGIGWNSYGANYLSFGPSQDGTNRRPLAGWYFKDSNNVVRQLLNSPLWFSGGNPSPYPNGNGWMAVANGSFYINPSVTTITFYETSPV